MSTDPGSTDPGDAPARPRRGRRPGASDSRQTVLNAARTRFALDGYAAATIRKIAADAGVDAALVMQFFGSKEELFAAVMSFSPAALSRMGRAFDGPAEHLGERLTRAYLELWEGDPEDSEPLLAMLRPTITNERAAGQLREFPQARACGRTRPPPYARGWPRRCSSASSWAGASSRSRSWPNRTGRRSSRSWPPRSRPS